MPPAAGFEMITLPVVPGPGWLVALVSGRAAVAARALAFTVPSGVAPIFMIATFLPTTRRPGVLTVIEVAPPTPPSGPGLASRMPATQPGFEPPKALCVQGGVVPL